MSTPKDSGKGSRVSLVTGTSSGIGEALALELISSGSSVWGISRRPAADLTAFPDYRHLSLDLVQEEEVRSVLKQALAACGELDLVILNAGILGPIADLSEVPLEDFRRIMEINVWANKTLLDVLFEKVSSIRQVVAISSGASVNGNRGWGGYSISKAALNMLMKVASTEHPGTHFCSLAPGLVDTAMQDALCGQELDDRFPSLDELRRRRGTEAMPTPQGLAPRLLRCIGVLPDKVPSGAFADIRTLDWE